MLFREVSRRCFPHKRAFVRLSTVNAREVLRIPHYSTTPGRGEVEVWVAHTNDEIAEWVRANIKSSPSIDLGHVVGLDVEWRPPFKPRTINPVALVQVASESSVLLVQLNRFPGSFPSALAEVINSETVIKVGVSVLDDLKLLTRDYGVKYSDSYSDIGSLARRLSDRVKSGKGVDTSTETPTLPLTFGLQSISKAFLGVDISKPRKIRLGNWDNKVLNLDQITYAAYDALLSRDIYCYCYALLQKESRGIE
jgi:hypothetical protein